MTDGVAYRSDVTPSLDEFIDLYRSSGLAERRPAEDRARMAAMLAAADLLVTAWDGDELVGVARSLSDRVYVTYLSDIAVARSHQHRGIGRQLVRETVAACDPACQLVLLAAPAATGYYPRLGFEAHPSAWVLRGFPTESGEDTSS